MEITFITPASEKALQEIKNGRSPGLGWINLELLKYGYKIVVKVIMLLFNKILAGDPLEAKFKEYYLKHIYNTADKKYAVTTEKFVSRIL